MFESTHWGIVRGSQPFFFYHETRYNYPFSFFFSTSLPTFIQVFFLGVNAWFFNALFIRTVNCKWAELSRTLKIVIFILFRTQSKLEFTNKLDYMFKLVLLNIYWKHIVLVWIQRLRFAFEFSDFFCFLFSCVLESNAATIHTLFMNSSCKMLTFQS